jgi:hypothetical protein
MLITNQQVEDAIAALEAFNPAINFRAKLRLNRNLRQLTQARQNKEHDRIRLAHSVVKDKTKKMEAGSVTLTNEEAAELQAEYKTLMQTQVEVDLRPLTIYDGRDSKAPKDLDFAIDASVIALDNRVLSSLLDVVLVEAS